MLQVPSLPCAAAPSAGPVAVASAVLTSGRCHGGGQNSCFQNLPICTMGQQCMPTRPCGT